MFHTFKYVPQRLHDHEALCRLQIVLPCQTRPLTEVLADGEGLAQLLAVHLKHGDLTGGDLCEEKYEDCEYLTKTT